MKLLREEKILSPNKVAIAVESLQKKRKKVVFTNGCFDLLHIGHIRYLYQAKKLAHVLVVALNSDSSVQKIKGKSRPLTPLKERMELMASLEMVDMVTCFYAETPDSLIKKIKPNVLVKGGDWSVDKIVGANFVQSYGGVVKSLSYKKNTSTTKIIEKIKRTDF